jgi:hypothetical protein
VLANIREESQFDPTLRHPDQPKFSGEAHFAHGLYQEGGDEWNNYQKWLNKNHPGADWRDPTLQSRFAAENLRQNYPATWKRMLEGDKTTAAETYVHEYLKPAQRYQASRVAKFRREGVPDLPSYGTSQDTTGGTPTPPPPALQPGERPQSYNYFQKQGLPQLSRRELITIDTPFGKTVAHPQAAEDARNFFKALGEAGAPIKRLGDYNPRPKRWGGGPSSHGYVTAWDIDNEQYLSPAMRKWIADNPETWANLKEQFNMGQPLPKKDPAHIEWRGPKPGGALARRDQRTSGGVPYLEQNVPGMPALTDMDRSGFDREAKQSVNVRGDGTLKVDVNAPKGTSVKANGNGLFKKTEVTRRIQMQEADQGPTTPRVAGGSGGVDEE